MSLPFVDRLTGASIGLAVGDSLTKDVARLSPEAAAQSSGHTLDAAPKLLLHGAMTTWALQIAGALRFRSPSETLADALQTRLCTWVQPLGGLAVRGATGGFASAIRQVGTSLGAGEDPRLCALDEVRADVIPALLPLAFTVGDADDDVARALVEAACVTHRALRVSTSAALFIGGVRFALREESANLEDRLEAAIDFARLVQAKYIEVRSGLVVGRALEAEGARALAVAAVRATSNATPDAVWAPPTLDGRDAPERCALGALLGWSAPASDVLKRVTTRAAAGGDADVTVALWLAGIGATVGSAGLPLGLTSRLLAPEVVTSRMRSLAVADVPMRADLVVEELALSQQLQRASRPEMSRGNPAAEPSDGGGQMALRFLSDT